MAHTESRNLEYEIRYLDYYGKKPQRRFDVNGIGVKELMEECIIHRPKGSGDWLLMYFEQAWKLHLNNKIINVPENHLMIWSPDIIQCYGNQSNKWRHSWLHFDGSEAEYIIQESGFKINEPFPCKGLDILDRYLRRIYEEKMRPDHDRRILESQFHSLMLELKRINQDEYSYTPERMNKARMFLEKNYFKKISLDEIASAACMSVSHFSREFQQHFNNSPIDYLMHLRIEKSLYMLSDLEKPLGLIAEEVGFNSQNYFCRVFKKFTGRSPGAFRKERSK